MSKLHVKKGDTVVVISGEDAGKQGKILQVLTKSGKAVVEGLNLVKRHTKKSQKNQQGGIVEKEAPLPVSKLRKVEGEEKKAAPKKKAAAAKKAPAAKKTTKAKAKSE
jgi:large subunit ribosomal protein L24